MNNIKVKLKNDLTKYNAALVIGTEGYTVGRYGMWSRGSDRFITVCFPQIETLDILWESLEIIDKKYLKEEEIRKKNFFEALKTAHNVEEYVGPRGGFRALHYEYSDNGTEISASNGFKEEANKIKDFFIENKIEIKRIIES